MPKTKEMEATTEEGTSLVSASPEELKLAYGAVLNGDVLPASADPEVMSQAIAQRIADAESFDEVFRPQSLPSWGRQFLGIPVRIRDVRLNRSTKSEDGKSGPSVYAVVDLLVVETGEMVTVQCGGRNVLVQLLKIVEKRWTEQTYRLVSKPTGSGYDVLWLEAV